MKLRINQSGFSAVETILVITVVAAIVFIGYLVYDRQQTEQVTDNNASQQSSGEQSSTANDVPSAPEIKSTEDLDKAEAVLDATEPGSGNSDADTLERETSSF